MEELNARRIDALEQRHNRYEVKDGSYPLYVVVQPSGVKSFVYRGKHEGKFIRKTVGQFPHLSLKKAREAAMAIRIAARKGDLPERRGSKARSPNASLASERVTVRQAWAMYMADEGEKRATADIKRARFDADVAPLIGDLPIEEVTHEHVDVVIQAKYDALVHAGKKGVAANRLYNHLARFSRWCRTKGRVKTGMRSNPMEDVVKRAEESSRRRYLDEKELRWFFQAFPVAGEFAGPFELMLRTLARRSEILTLDTRMIRCTKTLGEHIELAETKNGDPHLIPLHLSAAALLPPPQESGASRRVFPVSAQSCSNPVRRLRARMAEIASAEGAAIPHWTLHDLRRTGATHLPALGVSAGLVARILNHREKSVTGIYNRYDYYAEKRSALAAWNDYLDQVCAEATKRVDHPSRSEGVRF